MKTEYIAAMLTKSYKPEELNLLVEQERRDRAGSRVLASKTFTTSELEPVPMYSGEINSMDKTRAPGETLNLSSSLGATANSTGSGM